MSKIKYVISYEEKVIIVGAKGEKVEVGKLIEKIEDHENKTISYVVELFPQLPEELKKSIEEEPRVLQIVRVPKPATSILLIP